MKRKAHVRKDGSLSYKKEIRINGRRYSKRFSRIADAQKWYSEKKREKELVECGLALPASESQLKLSEFVTGWMDKRRRQGKPYGSWLTDQERLRKWILPAFGEREINRISSPEIELFLDQLVNKEGLAASTRNRVRAVFHKIYNDAKRQGLVPINPVSNVIPWKEKQHTYDYWHSIEECQAYLAQAELISPSFFVFAILALNTGARIGELLALQNEDVDLNHRRLHLWKLKEYRNGQIEKRTKGGGDRWLGINDEVHRVLFEHRKNSKFNRPKDFIIHLENGETADSRFYRELHWRACRRAGVRKIRVHDLRHTFASHYVMNGGTLHDLQALLGHSSPMMTQRYAHLAPGYLESKAQVVRIGKLCHHSATTSEVPRLKVASSDI